MFLLRNRKHTGLYNLGSGQARTWNDLTKAIFKALNLEPTIEYVDIPEDIRDTYQYFTEANMKKLHDIGYDNTFTSIEDAVADYVKNYLETGKYI